MGSSIEVIAIDDYHCLDGQKALTKGKKYRYLNHRKADTDHYYITDDMGVMGWFEHTHFRDVKKYRNKVLKDLLNDY